MNIFGELDWDEVLVEKRQNVLTVRYMRCYTPVSPASPEKAMRTFLFKFRVLSSFGLRMVAPLIAAFEAATMVKSLPVIPSKTSLVYISVCR